MIKENQVNLLSLIKVKMKRLNIPVLHLKHIIFFLVLFFPNFVLIYGQPLKVKWQKCLGGSDEEFIVKILKRNTGIFLFGKTSSNDGEVSGNHGSDDYWVVKTDTLGNILWSKTYGGSGSDVLTSVTSEPDGIYFISLIANNKEVCKIKAIKAN